MNIKLFRPRFQPYKNPNVIIEYTHNLPGKSAEELYYAQDVIGNYAKAKGVKVRFFGAKDKMEALGAAEKLKELCASRIGVSVYKETKFFPIQKTKTIDYSNTEKEPFLRQVYKTIENLVKEFKE